MCCMSQFMDYPSKNGGKRTKIKQDRSEMITRKLVNDGRRGRRWGGGNNNLSAKIVSSVPILGGGAAPPPPTPTAVVEAHL